MRKRKSLKIKIRSDNLKWRNREKEEWRKLWDENWRACVGQSRDKVHQRVGKCRGNKKYSEIDSYEKWMGDL